MVVYCGTRSSLTDRSSVTSNVLKGLSPREARSWMSIVAIAACFLVFELRSSWLEAHVLAAIAQLVIFHSVRPRPDHTYLNNASHICPP